MSYHTKHIPKGILGEMSKITEEYTELLDGFEQDNPLLVLCELADLLGAIEAYTTKKYNIELTDLIKMMHCTKNAFQSGYRK